MINLFFYNFNIGVRTGLKTYSEKPREPRVEKPVVRVEKKVEEP
jgi:hypothetical protein